MASEQDTRKFKILNSRLERLWSRVQKAYDLIPSLPVNNDKFLLRAEQVVNTYADYNEILTDLAEMSVIHDDFDMDITKKSDAFDELYFAVLSARNKFMVEQTTTTRSQINPTPPSNTRSYLPSLNIAKFSGNLEKFPGFIALYDSLIHKNSSFSDAEKFSFLIGYLEGSALKLAETVPFHPDNYTILYNLLRKEYWNKRALATNYLNAIFKLTPIKDPSAKTLKDLVETIQANVASLEGLNIPDLAQFILLHWSLSLVDRRTRREFELKFLGTEFPTFDKLVKFLRDTCTVNQLAVCDQSFPSSSNKIHTNTEKRRSFVTTQDESKKISSPSQFCPCGQTGHKFAHCPVFLQADLETKQNYVKTFQRCWSCLGRHAIANCLSTNKCKHCQSSKHHSVLHRPQQNTLSSNLGLSCTDHVLSPDVSNSPTSISTVSLHNSNATSSVDVSPLLGTAQVRIRDRGGDWHFCRVVVDPGSQVNLITSSLANRLSLFRRRCPFQVSGVGSSSLNSVQGLVSCGIAPLHADDFRSSVVHFDAAVVARITSEMPRSVVPPHVRSAFNHILLADPDFHKPAPIDVLLGVQAFLDVLPAQPSHILGKPSAISTSLGWVVMGSVPVHIPDAYISSLITSCTHCDSTLDASLRALWEINDSSSPDVRNPDDTYCEDYFSLTTTRDSTGRYTTRLPFVGGIRPQLGSTRSLAINRLLKLETRFSRDSEYFQLYRDNLLDYLRQGHMVKASGHSDYLMTHHGVMKRTDKGTKVRVVFSPAERDPSGASLNSSLLSGPKLQSEIGRIVTQFRLHRVPVTCDIKQMYRCIALHPDDCQFQRFLWRFSTDEPISEWELRTVTFGVSSSPWLALRTIQQLILDEGDKYPRAAQILKFGTYIDDFFFGAPTEEEAVSICSELISLCQSGGFELGKWASTSPTIMKEFSSDPLALPFPSDASSSVKVLGLLWDPSSDVFRYRIESSNEPITKRGILSRLARMFDLNGYLAPVTFAIKVFLQQIWLAKLSWDEPLTSELHDRWMAFEKEFSMLDQIRIPRYILIEPYLKLQIIGFSDASSFGMAAVVYLRVESIHGVTIHLLRSKTRVSPLKSWTINRLELGAACLLAKLVRMVLPISPSHPVSDVICLTDSSTALAWIRTPPYKLQSFVANRVTQIHSDVPEAVWRHVAGEFNSADPASRGLRPSELINNQFWWHGTNFSAISC